MLLKVFEYRTGASNIIRILRQSLNNTSAQVKGALSCFSTESGLKQGALESPSLFNIYFDFVIQISKYYINLKVQPTKLMFN